MNNLNTGDKVCWFVGAIIDDKDQSNRFIADGIWENGYENKYLDLVKSMLPGERIAIKSSYTRKHDLPFDNKNNMVSVIAIKAIGEITKNYNDGTKIEVEWTKIDPVKEWYFFTNRTTIWRVLPEEWTKVGLIDFAFHDKKQDIDRFRNDPFWRERFGDIVEDERRFQWTKFYTALADKLLIYKNDRSDLVSAIEKIAKRVDLSYLEEKLSNGTTTFLRDICPFTIFGMFNRGITDSNRKTITKELAEFLDIRELIPDKFDGIPTLNNLRSWFYGYEADRKPDDIDKLWKVFEEAIKHADSEETEDKSSFIEAYNAAANIHGVGWNLTMGLYWIRPWNYPTLDGNSRQYISKKLRIEIGLNGPQNRCSALDYFAVMGDLETRFQEDGYPVHSYPELSLSAWLYKAPTPYDDIREKRWKDLIYKYILKLCENTNSKEFNRQQFLEVYLNDLQAAYPQNNTIEFTIDRNYQLLRDDGIIEFLGNGKYRLLMEFPDSESENEIIQPPIETYTIDNIVKDGCFVDREEIASMLERFRTKKNLILQGPPGTGKTWLAKRLAQALMGQKDESRIRAVQFHPNLSYEDFIRGWRPVGEGKLSMVDGPFMESVKLALTNSSDKYVIVIEEINRGNPAQIFGEMLTLLEVDKRTPDEALELCYRREENERVYIPDNLYIIGTMNIADRSLALVDFALRRRFAFVELEPCFNEIWRKWVVNECHVNPEILKEIHIRITSLNEEIESDFSLGKQFRIGHSYVTPPLKTQIIDTRKWYIQVVKTEIVPLLEEYWFDKQEKVKKANEELLKGI